MYRKSLWDNIIHKTEYETLCNIFTKNIDEKNESFFKNVNIKTKLNFSSNTKLKFQPRT